MKKPRWKKEELQFIKKNYEYVEAKIIAKKLNRKIGAVYDVATKKLKLKRNIFGKNNHQYKKGFIKNSDGYILLSGQYECPYAKKKGRVYEHTYIWWKNNPNNPILLNECIHHINSKRDDNRIKNLKKMTIKEHNHLPKNIDYVKKSDVRKRNKEYSKQYYQNNKEKRGEYGRKYGKEYYQKNKEKINEKDRANYHKNKHKKMKKQKNKELS